MTFKNLSEKTWKFFASLRLTLILFVLLIVSVLVGSFIIQKPFAEDGQIEAVYSAQAIQVMEFFGLFDLYHSGWFSFLLFLFGVNNLCASIEMWPRHKKLYRHRDADMSLASLQNQPNCAKFTINPSDSSRLLPEITRLLKKYFQQPVQIATANESRLFVNKHPWSHFGVYVVHLGVLLVLFGGVYGSFDGFEGQMLLAEGQTSHQVRTRNRHAGQGMRFLDFQVKCHDIWIETYENGSPKDYYSDLEILDMSGQSMKRGVIQVNHPLEYQGVNFYQATYGTKQKNKSAYYDLVYIDAKTQKSVPMHLDAKENSWLVPGTNQSLKFVTYKQSLTIPLEDGPQDTGEFIAFELAAPKGEVEKVLLFKDIPDADGVYRPNAKGHFVFKGLIENYELEELTGLQVARDPGAQVVFFGSAILMVGVFLTFMTSHQKVWVVFAKDHLILAGKAHRNPWVFGKKFQKFADEVSRLVS